MRSSTDGRIPFAIFSVDTNTHLGVDDGAQLKMPDFTRLWSLQILLPTLIYVLMWGTVNSYVNCTAWRKLRDGLCRRRLINLTTSLIHSAVCAVALFLFIMSNGRMMFESPLYFYSYLHMQILLLSIGYFIYDAFDMMMNDTIAVTTVILLLHHLASIFVLATSVVSQKFLLYAYWALLMEVSSLSLHTRSILNISKLSKKMPTIAMIVSYANVVSFILFRFLVQIFLIGWAWKNMHNMHYFYKGVAFGGGLAFFIINISLFLRVLHSDGFVKREGIEPEQLNRLLDGDMPTATTVILGLDQTGTERQ